MNFVLPLATKPFLPKSAEAFFSNGGEKHNFFELIDWGTFSGICPSWKKRVFKLPRLAFFELTDPDGAASNSSPSYCHIDKIYAGEKVNPPL